MKNTAPPQSNTAPKPLQFHQNILADYLDRIAVNSKDKIMIGLMKPFKK
jgi:hypothetical protein